MQRLVGLLVSIALVSFSFPQARAYDIFNEGTLSQGTSISQTLLISRPNIVPLTFSYCNGQSCGNPQDPELDCYVNKYNPTFSEAFPVSLKVNPIGPGARPVKVFMKSGHDNGLYSQMGFYDANHSADWNKQILLNAPTFNSDGSVVLQFNNGRFNDYLLNKRAPSGRLCGLTEEEYGQFKKNFDIAFNNPDLAALKVTIVWQSPNGVMTNTGPDQFQQGVTLDGTKQQNLTNTIAPSLPPTPKKQPKVFSQTDSRWADQTAGNQSMREKGTVASATNAVLTTLTNSTETPDSLQKALQKNGVIDKQGETNWPAFGQYLATTQKVHVAETDVAGLVQTFANPNQPTAAIAAVTVSSTSGSHQSAVAIFGYDQKSDSFLVSDPAAARPNVTKVPTQTLLKENPWFLTVSS